MTSPTVFPTGNIYLDSLIWLTPSNPFGPDPNTGVTTITYAFGGPGTYAVHDPESTVDSVQATQWASNEQAAALQALQSWANVANINLVATNDFQNATFKFLVTNESGMRNYFSGEKGVLAFSTLPNDYGPNYGQAEAGYTPGYVVYNQEGYGWTQSGLLSGGYGYVTVVHEIGHLLGLDHPFDEGGWYFDATGAKHAEPYFPGATGQYKTGDYGLNQGIFTVMTYNDGWTGQPSKSTDWGYETGPGAFDIAAIQKLYGANTSYHTGDDAGLNAYTLPTANVSGTGWKCIWDAGGTDEIAAPLNAGSATIDLRAATLQPGDPNAGGYVSWVKGVAGGFTIANGVVIENATGGNANDTLTGNDAANILNGRGGADRMEGLAGDDTYYVDNTGDTVIEAVGGGKDTVYSSVSYTLAAGSEVEKLILTGSGGLSATGNGFDNELVGNAGGNTLQGGAGSDTLDGGAGNDRLVGGIGADKLTGGAGNDTFAFAATQDSPVGAGCDTICDFVSGADKIDLSAIDANPALRGDQAFTFIGSNAFDLRQAGELRYEVRPEGVVVSGDLNKDGVADFSITVAGINTLHGYDFVL